LWKIVVLRWDKETESCGTVKRIPYILISITRHDKKTGQMTLSEPVAHMEKKLETRKKIYLKVTLLPWVNIS
jgi:Golgi nucleoside diphosphatase